MYWNILQISKFRDFLSDSEYNFLFVCNFLCQMLSISNEIYLIAYSLISCNISILLKRN